jgi:putative ABC transport system ATP-binding protein
VIEPSPGLPPVGDRLVSVELAAGDVVFAEGEAGELAYVVETGEVELTRSLAGAGVEVLQRLGPGMYFGELAPLLGLPRSATARATRPSVVIPHPPHDLRRAIMSRGGASDLGHRSWRNFEVR